MASTRRLFNRHPRGDAVSMAVFMRDQILTGRATSLHLQTVPDGIDEVRVRTFVADERGGVVQDGVRGRIDIQIVEVPRRRIVSIEFDERPGAGSADERPRPRERIDRTNRP